MYIVLQACNYTFMLSLLNTFALEKMPKGILLIRLCSMLRE